MLRASRQTGCAAAAVVTSVPTAKQARSPAERVLPIPMIFRHRGYQGKHSHRENIDNAELPDEVAKILRNRICNDLARRNSRKPIIWCFQGCGPSRDPSKDGRPCTRWSWHRKKVDRGK